jgi:hypothetical protein
MKLGLCLHRGLFFCCAQPFSESFLLLKLFYYILLSFYIRRVTLRIILLFTVFFSLSTFADRGIYIGADVGKTNAVRGLMQFEMEGEEDDVELSYDSNLSTVITLGYGFNIWHLELISANLGETGFKYGEYLTYERQTKFTGIGSRWRWGWFSLRYGFGKANVTNKVKDTTSGLQSVTHDLETEDKSYGATLFSMGLNIPITESFMLNLESTSITWGQDDGKILYDNGAGTTGDEDLGEIQMVWMFTVGLRFYIF